jgi:hypothetical protein
MARQDIMRYLCLIHLDEKQLDAMPAREMAALNAEHLDYDDVLRRGGQFIEAEALEPASATTCVRVRQGRTSVTDGPFAEAKEQIAGFFLIEARDLNEAIQVAANIPAARLGAVEVRPVRQLVVPGRSS